MFKIESDILKESQKRFNLDSFKCPKDLEILELNSGIPVRIE